MKEPTDEELIAAFRKSIKQMRAHPESDLALLVDRFEIYSKAREEKDGR